jgi:hypothetical protein
MFDFIDNNKWKIYGGIAIFVIAFSLGAYARTGIDKTYDVIATVFGGKKVEYVAPLSEYERLSQEAYNDPKHQAVCLAQARATVSLELTQKYLSETKKQQLLSEYELPLSLVGK